MQNTLLCAAASESYTFIRKPRCSLVNRLLNHIVILNCLKCFLDLKVTIGLIFKSSVTHQTGKKGRKHRQHLIISLCVRPYCMCSSKQFLSFRGQISSLSSELWPCSNSFTINISNLSLRLLWMTIKLLLLLQSEASPSGGGGGGIQISPINQICCERVNRSVAARCGKGKDLMKGLRGEAENGGRSPSPVLFGCEAATVAAFESHAWVNPARYTEKVNRWSIREAYITLLTSTSVLFSESNFYKAVFTPFWYRISIINAFATETLSSSIWHPLNATYYLQQRPRGGFQGSGGPSSSGCGCCS